MGIAIRFNLPLPGPGWSVKTLFPDREAIFKAAAMEVPELGAKFSGPFLRDPKPSLFRQSFKAGYDADKFSMSIVNIANKGGKGYAKFVRLARSIDPKRVAHLPVVGLKIKAVILPQIQDGLIKTAVRTATRAYTRGKR